MKDLRFTQENMKKTYPAMLRLTLTPEQAFSLAMDLLRHVETSRYESFTEKSQEFPLFGVFQDLGQHEDKNE